MDNAYNQSMVAYEDGPKEVNTKRGLHDGDKQFGTKKMPQDEKSMHEGNHHVKKMAKPMHHGRHKEHR